MICPSCSNPIPDGIPICPYCGATLTAQEYPWEPAMAKADKAKKKQTNAKAFLIALGSVLGAALLVLVIVFGIVPAVKNRQPKTPASSSNNTGYSADTTVPSWAGTDQSTTAPGSGAGESPSAETQPPVVETQPPAVKTLTVAPIADAPMRITDSASGELTNDTVVYAYYTGEIVESRQTDIFEFYADCSGAYRCEVNGLKSGVTVTVNLCEDGIPLDSEYQASNGKGVTRVLDGGKTYTVEVKSGTGTGTYELSVGMPKPVCDITAVDTVYDAIEFKGQQNYYAFTPDETGEYRFWISQINSGKTVSLFVYDDAGYTVGYEYGASQNDGVKTTLNAGITYTVCVKQNSDYGAYTLRVGRQKTARDITGTTVVYDSTVFQGQRNNYYYTAPCTGTYSFRIAQINSGIKVSVYVYDSADYCLGYENGASLNGGVTVTLEAGQTYLVQVRQYTDVGDYAMSVGSQKPFSNATGYDRIKDSTQFAKQTNYYTYTPSLSGNYVFSLYQIPSGVRVSVFVYDDAGYEVGSRKGLSADGSVKVSLNAGRTYEICVQQYEGFGEYTLNIGLTN